MTKDEFKDLFRMVLAGWPAQRTKLSEVDVDQMSKLYAAGLGDLEFNVAYSALVRLVHTAKFLPTVAEIREAAGVVMYGHQITGITAWGEVTNAIKSKGSYRRPGTKAEVEQGAADFVIENPITLRIIRTLSWQDLCAGDHDTMVSNRARFADEYDKIAGQERENMQASYGFKEQPTLRAGAAPVTPRAEVEWKKPLKLPSGEERSKMLHDILDSARHNAPAMFGELASSVLKDKLVTEPAANVEPACSCTQYHGIDEFGRCLECRREKKIIEKTGNIIAFVQNLNLVAPTCECIEEYSPLDEFSRCPNCKGIRRDPDGFEIHGGVQ